MNNIVALSLICAKMDAIFTQINVDKKSHFDICREDFGELDDISGDLVENWLLYASACDWSDYRFFIDTQFMVTIQKYQVESVEDIMSLSVLKEGLYFIFKGEEGWKGSY